MLTIEQFIQQIPFCLQGTHFDGLGEFYEGKVRDNYIMDRRRILITSDRLSAFDKVITTIPFKGQVLNQMARFWFEQTKDIVPNHILEYPDPNVLVARQCTPLPVEMVVRGYLTGVTSTSVWHAYQKGERNFCGNKLPDGMQWNQKFEQPIITPSTKAEHGDHDESVAPEVILERTGMSREDYDYLADVSMKLYLRGVEIAARQGIILVDTKYEFGRDAEGKIVLIDEIHTPDSSRFWFANDYQGKFEVGEEQRNINKEYLRTWLADHNFKGDGEVPVVPDDVRAETARRYIEAYELITGRQFEAKVENVYDRVKLAIQRYL